MYDQQVNSIKHMVEKLGKKAGFKKIPTLKISGNKQLFAEASFIRKKITVSTGLLSQWQKGEIDKNDVEVTLAHETGHLMDFERKLGSVFFRYTAIVVLYLGLGFILLRLVWFPHLPEPMIPPLLAFSVWMAFLYWILRTAAHTVQLEADRIGASLISDTKFVKSIVKRGVRTHDARGFGPIKAWNHLLYDILWPSPSERLLNLNFKIKEIKAQRRT